ncbi:ester cyclase [Aestuariivirga litoralis]|uniref:ester cyclase n=1 Tax=Aestuariivirga litoralis TaxID=2650924 RepID=UPI0018C673D1|nr:ester cyclase [Aestuariivirga litoralis]MBG1233133.1 ester cyclase [Aestuariivirga litoralis]
MSLESNYRGYIACLNAQDWARLGDFVHEDAVHNGDRFGLAGYRRMLERDFREIPDLRFNIELLVCDADHVSARLVFDCSPKGEFFGLPINGRRVTFQEHVIYKFRDGKVAQVWSVIDTGAIVRQLSP